MSTHYRGPSIDASYQVSIHLAKGFQRRRLKCEKFTDDGHPSELKMQQILPFEESSIFSNGCHLGIVRE